MAIEFSITDDFEEGCLARSQDVLEALGLADDEPPEEEPAPPELPVPVAMKPDAVSAYEANSPTLRLRDRRSIKKPAHTEFDDDTPQRSSPKFSRSGGPGSPLSKHGLATFGGRKLYLCRWCGLPKKNHVCEGAVDASVLASRQRAARSAQANSSPGSSSSSLSTMMAEEDTGADSFQNESDDAEPVEISTRGTGRTRARQQQRSAPMSTSMVIDTDCSDLFDVSPSGITAIGSRIEGAFMCDSGAMQWYASLPDARVSLRDSVPIGPLPQCPSAFGPCPNALHCRFGGVISEFSQSTGEHLVIYDDGEQKWHDLDEGVATKALRWPGGHDLWGAGEDEGPVTPKAPPVPVERVESMSPRKRRAPEPAPQTEGTPTLVCDYCSSRGKVHRKCLRLESCPIIWKRNGKSKARTDAEQCNRSPATPGTPELIRSGRAPALPPAKRAQVLSARTLDSSPVPHSPAADADEWQHAPTPSSELWPFPVIVPPEALGWNISQDGAITHSSGPPTDESVAELL